MAVQSSLHPLSHPCLLLRNGPEYRVNIPTYPAGNKAIHSHAPSMGIHFSFHLQFHSIPSPLPSSPPPFPSSYSPSISPSPLLLEHPHPHILDTTPQIPRETPSHLARPETMPHSFAFPLSLQSSHPTHPTHPTPPNNLNKPERTKSTKSTTSSKSGKSSKSSMFAKWQRPQLHTSLPIPSITTPSSSTISKVGTSSPPQPCSLLSSNASRPS